MERNEKCQEEIEIPAEMMEAGIRAFRLFDRGTLPEYVVWAVFQDMAKKGIAMGVLAMTSQARL